ncbi:MAG: hypothetical protein LBK99_17470 [Opitutaceae bacterium]|jgi:hypothetical protein|nr:hypothetical protein [Opitutaceae bacterium]
MKNSVMVKMADFFGYAIDGLTGCVNDGSMDKKVPFLWAKNAEEERTAPGRETTLSLFGLRTFFTGRFSCFSATAFEGVFARQA